MMVSRVFQRDPMSIREARRLVASVAAGTGVDPEVAALLTNELAANAVMHAETDFQVRVIRDARGVRVEVVNDAPEMIAALREADDQSGRGLRIVQTLASAWGIEASDAAKTVWFELHAQEAEAQG
jgi:hypothetical protein